MEIENVRAAPGLDLILQTLPILLRGFLFVGNGDVGFGFFIIIDNLAHGSGRFPKPPKF